MKQELHYSMKTIPIRDLSTTSLVTYDLKDSSAISFAAWKALLILTGTTILILSLHTSLSPAIPVIADEFGVDQTLAAWVVR